jgi:hypothetical protein
MIALHLQHPQQHHALALLVTSPLLPVCSHWLQESVSLSQLYNSLIDTLQRLSL